MFDTNFIKSEGNMYIQGRSRGDPVGMQGRSTGDPGRIQGRSRRRAKQTWKI
jgi:hypothetical protein